jgi:hypothetical protein
MGILLRKENVGDRVVEEFWPVSATFFFGDEGLTVDNPQSRSSVETYSIYHLRDDGFNNFRGEIKQRKNANITRRSQG